MRILNGRTKGDRSEKFTRYPLSLRETRSTLDYMIADNEVLENIKYFTVLSHLGLSDHECLSLLLKTEGFIAMPYAEARIIKERPIKYASDDEFLMKLNSPLGKEKLKKFLNLYSNSLDTSIESMTADLVDIINTTSSASNNWKSKKKNKKKGEKGREKKTSPWYSSECKKLKWSLNRAEKEYRKDPFNLRKKESFYH